MCMRIQPISTNRQPVSFQAVKLRKLPVKAPSVKTLAVNQELNKNYGQAILFAIASAFAALTKSFIDMFNVKQKTTAVTETPNKQPAEQKM